MPADSYVTPVDDGVIDMRLNKEQMAKLAHRVGKRLLTDDTFLDDLADALDGIDLQDELSVTDDEPE